MRYMQASEQEMGWLVQGLGWRLGYGKLDASLSGTSSAKAVHERTDCSVMFEIFRRLYRRSQSLS